MNYTVLYAPTATGYSAHVPDLPGCIGAATILEETRRLMKEAIGRLEACVSSVMRFQSRPLWRNK